MAICDPDALEPSAGEVTFEFDYDGREVSIKRPPPPPGWTPWSRKCEGYVEEQPVTLNQFYEFMKNELSQETESRIALGGWRDTLEPRNDGEIE